MIKKKEEQLFLWYIKKLESNYQTYQKRISGRKQKELERLILFSDLKIMTDDKEERRTAISLVYKEIREQLPNLSKENLWKKTEGARKANFIFTVLGKSEIKKMKKISMDWITRTCWDDIKEFVIEERAKRSEGKIQILEEMDKGRMRS